MMVAVVERSAPVDDLDVVRRMGEPADEEPRLECSPAGEGLPEEELAPLRTIEVALDQCWDLLRQRHARRAAGGNPDEVAVRPEATVGGYQQ
jgi:Protein of unknown function (DUF2630)